MCSRVAAGTSSILLSLVADFPAPPAPRNPSISTLNALIDCFNKLIRLVRYFNTTES